MRILINALAAHGGGSETYLRGLLPALGKVDPKTKYYVLRSPWQKFWDFDLPHNVHLLEVKPLQKRSILQRAVWEQVNLPSIIRKYQIDVLYCPTDIASLLAPCPIVLAIRNPNPYLGSAIHRGWFYLINRKVILRSSTWISARKAARIIFVSDFSCSVVCQQLRIPLSKVKVIHHGLGAIFSDNHSTPDWIKNLPQPYILSVSGILGHKNYPFLVHAFTEVIQRTSLPHHLVVAGKPVFQQHVTEMFEITNRAGLRERLHLLGEVAYNELPALYQQADLFVLSSLLETFGHTLVEAMASGVPVVSSNTTSQPEICGDAAIYFDPLDLSDAIVKISQVLTDHSLREQLVNKGIARSTEFSWEKTAGKTVSVLKAAKA